MLLKQKRGLYDVDYISPLLITLRLKVYLKFLGPT